MKYYNFIGLSEEFVQSSMSNLFNYINSENQEIHVDNENNEIDGYSGKFIIFSILKELFKNSDVLHDADLNFAGNSELIPSDVMDILSNSEAFNDFCSCLFVYSEIVYNLLRKIVPLPDPVHYRQKFNTMIKQRIESMKIMPFQLSFIDNE